MNYYFCDEKSLKLPQLVDLEYLKYGVWDRQVRLLEGLQRRRLLCHQSLLVPEQFFFKALDWTYS